MFDDDNLSLYAYVLVAAGVVFGASFFTEPAQIQVAALRPNAEEIGAIETATVARAAAPLGAEAWNFPTIPWRTYEDGLQQMAREGKPGVLVLQADWCLVCRSYQRLFDAPEIEKHADDYVFILADIEAEPELQRRFDVDGDYIPRTFVLEADGGLREDATGTHPRQKFFVDPFDARELSGLLETGPAPTAAE